MTEPRGNSPRRWPWAWIFLAASVVPAVWFILDFESALDPEFPKVLRKTYSAFPPAAYRLGDAGDSIDCAAMYITSAALVLTAWGSLRDPRRGLRWAGLALSAVAFWHACTPGPLFNGWHGLGWRTMFDPSVPMPQRLALAGFALLSAVVVIAGTRPWNLRAMLADARARGVLGLLSVAAVLMVVRQLPGLDREPFGYWPRWVYVWGVLAWALAMLRLAPKAAEGRRGVAIAATLVVASVGLDVVGRNVLWVQRPINRLREIIPGRLYLCAMPTYDGLRLAQPRYGFKTIINLFPEFTEARSPHWPDEQRFARENGIAVYTQSADDPTGLNSVPETLAIANDPANWPVLVHCHGSMDRSPAWVGMYRFAYQGWPLDDVIREIEHHRGSRPKSSVTLLYNRTLPRLAPERAASDPTARDLRERAIGTPDPMEALLARMRAEEEARRR